MTAILRSRWHAAPAVLCLVLVLAACSSQPTGSPAASGSGSLPGAPSSSSPVSAPSGGGQNLAEALQQEFVGIVEKVGASVVVIQTDRGLGSGIVFDDKGHVVTNAHVVEGASTVSLVTADGHRLGAKVLGSFTPDDLAVVTASGGDNLEPAAFGDSSKLAVGDIVLAIGNPLGLQSSVTEGIVSALNRTVTESGGAALPGVIQTSAPINPGNSGGALVNLDGEVIGIPTLAATDPQLGGSAPGIGFAIPSNMASNIAKQLIEHGRVVSSGRAYLGIRAADVMGSQGVLVYSVDPGGPAAQAGIPADVLITAINDQATPDQATLSSVLANLAPDETVTVRILRADGSSKEIKVKLGELPG